ncbi:Mbov_0399 family ICE element protein [Mesomycoplasma ovipneumoniae]|uniref:Mbov_0399 family ICE element protein n=1 Tax=Mesomycoplasma ovipneumoniae TaxID=29562 RepID=UPI00311B430E
MHKKIPFFLISGLIPVLFLSAGYQNTAYFKLNNYDNYEIKSEFANFSAQFDLEIERQPDSFSFEWIKDKNIDSKSEIRKLNSYWFDRTIKEKFYKPGSKPEIRDENLAPEYCSQLESCRNWQFYLSESRFRDWKQETIFNIYGEYDKSIFDRNSLSITSKKHSKINISDILNEYAKNKIGELEKNFNLKNIKISHLIYSVGFELQRDKIKKFTVNLQYRYSYQKRVLNKDLELEKYLSDLRQNFNNSIIKNNQISIKIETNQQNNNEIQSFSLTSSQKGLKEIEKKVAEFSSELFKKGKKYNADLHFNVIGDTQIEFFIRFKHPQDKNFYNFQLNNKVNVRPFFENNDKFWKRLTIIPGNIYDSKTYESKIDEPVKISEPKSETIEGGVRKIYGGKWEYHNKIKLNFITNPDENEILYVNGNPVDVLDLNFDYDLEDLRLEQKNQQNSTNSYKIEIKKFKKDNKIQDNSELVAIYEIEFVIKAANSIMDIKWFAWDPKNNKDQQKLIEPYLKDKNDQIIYDQFGVKVKNPEYDPLIDVKTGTKKQIVWVSTGKNPNSIPENSNFAQLPSEISRFNLGLESEFGFIAEASVSGKGANIVLNSNPENDKVSSFRYLVDSDNSENFEILNKNGQKSEKFDITNSANKYFSMGGVWLFSSKFDKGLSSYKIVSIGENSSSQLFNDVFPNKSIIPFWESKAGQILEQYLLLEKITSENIKKLTYEQILLYWRNFIDNVVKTQQIKKINQKLDENIEIKNKIVLLVQKNLNFENLEQTNNQKTGSNHGFESSTGNKVLEINPEMISEISKFFVDDNENSSNIDIKIENIVQGQDNKFDFDIKIVKKDDKKAENFEEVLGILSFSDIEIKDSEQNKNKAKIKFNLKNDKHTVNQNLQNSSQIIDYFSNQENFDKVNLFLEENDENIIANFDLKPEFKELFHLQTPFIIVKKSTKNSEIFQNSKNIFDELLLERINLTGIENLQNAKNFILQQIQASWKDVKYNYNVDFVIENFDNVVENAIKNAEESEQIPHKIWNLALKVKENQINKFYGSKTIKLVNIIGSLNNPKISNLNQIKAKEFSLSISKNSENLENAIKDHVYNLLLPEEIDSKKYLYLQNISQIVNNFRTNPKLEKATLVLKPGTPQLNGKKELTIFNSDFTTLNDLTLSGLEKNSEITKSNISKSTAYWLIPLIIFSIIGLLFFCFWIYNKFIAKFKN